MQFAKPVRVGLTPAQSTYMEVGGPAHAARFLLDRWPSPTHSAKFLAACQAVTEANRAAQDRMLAEKARKAFAAAADEANLLMPDAVRPKPVPGAKSPNWRGRRVK